MVAQDVVALRFEAADGRGDLPEWEPGAHIDVVLDSGLVRQYSLCGATGDRSSYRVAVLRCHDGRGGSDAVHRLALGAEVDIRGPRNHFELLPAQEYLFIAGGIGITPLMPMMEEADRLGRRWRLVYGGRSLASMAFVDEVLGMRGDVDLRPQDEHGLLDLRRIVDGAPSASVYACGPEPLLTALEGACESLERPKPHVERFAAVEVDTSHDRSFEVELAGSRRIIQVSSGCSILAALEDAGLSPEFSCREGTCGTCETAVLSGEIDHRDVLLTDEERAANDTMMICVSRATGERLVLDL